MKVRILLFAAARHRVGSEAIECDVSSDSTIAELRQALLLAAPELGSLARSPLAVNAEYAAETMRIPFNSEIALIPPVSGG